MGISYSVEVDEERTAKAMGRELSISKKDAVEVCREVKGMPLQEAREKLRSVADEETPIPRKRHNAGVGHRSDLEGWDAGSFPKKATEEILDVLYNAVSNAENQGYDPDEMTVQHIAAHKVGESRGMKPRAMGRATQWNGDLVDVEVVVLQEDYDPRAQKEEEEEEEQEAEEAAEEADEAEGTEPDEEEAKEGPETLTDVEGIGDSKAGDLRDAGYESVEDLREATQDDISDVDGIGNALAARIKADVGGIEVDEEEVDEEDSEAEDEGQEDASEEAEPDETEAESDDEEENKGGDT